MRPGRKSAFCAVEAGLSVVRPNKQVGTTKVPRRGRRAPSPPPPPGRSTWQISGPLGSGSCQSDRPGGGGGEEAGLSPPGTYPVHKEVGRTPNLSGRVVSKFTPAFTPNIVDFRASRVGLCPEQALGSVRVLCNETGCSHVVNRCVERAENR